MGLNNDGISGVSVEHVALEKMIIVGAQAPNISPSIKIDPNGKSLPKLQIAQNGGSQVLSTAGWDCSYADTSWTSHGGIYSVLAGNKINLTAGGAGFEWKTAGPSQFNVAFQQFVCTHCFDVNTRLFSVASTERTHLMGGRFDADYNEIYFKGNTNFINNVHINGGLFVNGEFFCTHMTAQKQLNFTQPNADINGFINPGQSFTIFNGRSLASEKLIQPTLGWTQLDNLPDKVGMVDCWLAVELPGTGLIEVPCRLGFPKGISLMSDAMYKQVPQAESIVMAGDKRPLGCGTNMADLSGPGHIHAYSGPAVNYLDNTGSVFSEAAAMMSSDTPCKSKPCTPNGAASFDQVPNVIVQATKNSLKEYFKNLWKNISPWGS